VVNDVKTFEKSKTSKRAKKRATQIDTMKREKANLKRKTSIREKVCRKAERGQHQHVGW